MLHLLNCFYNILYCEANHHNNFLRKGTDRKLSFLLYYNVSAVDEYF